MGVLYPGPKRGKICWILNVLLGSRALQRLPDYIGGRYFRAEQHRRNLSDFSLLLIVCSRSGQRCGGSDHLKLGRAEEFASAPNQQGYVCALPPPVRVQFIKYKEAQALCCFYELLFVDPGE